MDMIGPIEPVDAIDMFPEHVDIASGLRHDAIRVH